MTNLVQKWIERHDLEVNRHRFYLFGDNVERVGMGGQAGAMRGERNAIGIPTKWTPSSDPAAFFRDSDFVVVKEIIDKELKRVRHILGHRGEVVLPADGLGTGLSRLPETSPKISDYLDGQLSEMGWKKGDDNVWTA